MALASMPIAGAAQKFGTALAGLVVAHAATQSKTVSVGCIEDTDPASAFLEFHDGIGGFRGQNYGSGFTVTFSFPVRTRPLGLLWQVSSAFRLEI